MRPVLEKRLPVAPRSEGQQAPQGSSSTSPDESSSKSISLSIFCIVAVLVCVATWCMTRRKAAVRRRRRERALSEWQEMVARRGFVDGRSEKGPEPPVMYQVCLEQSNAEDGGSGYGDKDIGWKETMPISTSLAPLVHRNSSMALEDADHQIDPHLGIPVSQLSRLAELSSQQQQSVRHRLQARWQCRYPYSSPPSTPDTPASPRNVLTSVLIAMPTPHPHSCPGQFCAGAGVSDDARRFVHCQEVPEVSFGVYEAPWTCNWQG